MLIRSDKPIDKRMIPVKLGAGDMAIINLVRVRQGAHPPFSLFVQGRQVVYDPYNDDFITIQLVKDAFNEEPIPSIPIYGGALMLNGNNPDDRVLFEFFMLLDSNESKPHRLKATKPEFYIGKLVVKNNVVQMTPEGRLIAKGADMISRKKRRAPSGAEASILDTIALEEATDVEEEGLPPMTQKDLKTLLYALIDRLNADGLLDAQHNAERGIVTVMYKDESGAKQPLVAFESRTKGVWLNTLKSRLWKRRDEKPRPIATILTANEAITNELLFTLFSGKYNRESLAKAFPAIEHEKMAG